MIFNSLDFLIFLPVVFFSYWLIGPKNLFSQNVLLLISSYFFYSWWDYRFLGLIVISTVVDYFTGHLIYDSKKDTQKKFYLAISVICNLTILGFFKYYNFFAESFVDLVSIVGYTIHNKWTLNIILPVGISFYTFQTMSYSFDIFRGEMKPTKSFINFAAFVSFFPQLVAGPIERARHLLPQIEIKRKFKYREIIKGLRLVVWGMFKKVVVADSLASYVNVFYSNHNDFTGLPSLVAILFFTFQIYLDFSGYSDIAIGTARLFGIKLNRNFNLPYISKSVSEFWKRWHISLSSWFRDYLYIPIGGSRVNQIKIYRNLMITFIVSGLWHGANYTFIVWGGINGLLLISEQYFQKLNLNLKIPKTFSIIQTFLITNVAWVFFRSENLKQAIEILKGSTDITLDYNAIMFSFRGLATTPFELVSMFSLIIFVMLIEVYENYLKSLTLINNIYIQYIFIQFLIFMILFFANKGDLTNFIYFQF